MPLVKNIEKLIWDCEGFDVRIKNRNDRDVKSDMKGKRMYPYKSAANNKITVTKWRQNRFHKLYHEYKVDVLNGKGVKFSGNTMLKTVRESYREP
jgi:hypothetical protein